MSLFILSWQFKSVTIRTIQIYIKILFKPIKVNLKPRRKIVQKYKSNHLRCSDEQVLITGQNA